MKKISAVLVMGVFLFLSVFGVQAQQSANFQGKSIEPYRLEITHSKTTNIVFPYAIVSVDRGSKDILAQKAIGVQNILQVKAARDSFPETNLSIVTADGKLNSFVVRYAKEPSVLNLSLSEHLPYATNIFLSKENVNEAEIQSCAKEAIASKEKIQGIVDKNFGISFQINGVFIHDEVLYFRMSIENQSNIGYTIDQLRFFIRDQKKAKRTATQEIEVTPIYVESDTDKIAGNQKHTIVFALPKFTIPDNKLFAIQLMEKNGGRHLELHVKNKHIVKATVIQAPNSIATEDLIRF